MGNSTGIHRILVADSNPLVSRCFKEVLSPLGHFVDFCQTPEESLIRLKDDKFSILIMDIQPPKGCGLEILREIRGQKRETSVILTSIWPSDEAKRACRDFDRVQFLQKPFGLIELRTAVERIGDPMSC